MRLIPVIVAFSALTLSAPAFAQAIAPGIQITDPNGGSVGTVKAVQGDNLLVTTGTHEALLPKASFTANNGKLLFGLTQAQLNAEIEKSQAAATAAVAAGATVKGLQGTEIGKIDSVTDTAVVIALPSGKKIQVARNGVRGNPDGSVTVGLTADQLNAAQSADAAPSSSSAQ
jgi:preprotein translocase subunit YajC